MKILKWPVQLQTFAAVFLTVLLCIANSCKAQNKGDKTLLALSKADHTLALVDPVTLKVQARIPVGSDPHEVIASADGKQAFVSIYEGGSLHELNIIDLVSKRALPGFDTRPFYGPHGLVYEKGKVWFSAEGSKSVASYDPATGKLDWSMGTGEGRTHMIYVSPDANRIYTTNMSSGTVSILESVSTTPASGGAGTRTRQEWNHTVIPVVAGIEGFDVLADGSQLWTASGNGTVGIIDLKTKQLIQKIDAKVVGANRLRFTPDNKLALISSLQTGELTVFNVKTRKELKRLKLGKGAAGILMDTDGSRAFVACSADNYVAVVDLKTLEVTGHFDVGGTPDGLAWAIVR